MASNRHLGRIVAMQTLYECDFRREIDDKKMDVDAIIERNIGRYSEVMEDKAFVKQLIEGVIAKQHELDEIIQPLAPEWPLDQIARIDRVILRMGVYELRYTEGVPIKVIINEAVELAKGFGANNSSKFVNGVLGSAYKQISGTTEKKEATTKNRPAKKKGAKT